VEHNCIYAKFKNERLIFLVIYVDNIVLASNDKNILLETKRIVSSRFNIKYLEEAFYVL
jgi:hypothetical protein